MRIPTKASLILAIFVAESVYAHSANNDAAPIPQAVERNPMRTWIGRPWEWRYIIYVDTNWSRLKEWATERDAENIEKKGASEWMPYFDPIEFLPSKRSRARPGDGISVVLIEFDRKGNVLTTNTYSNPLVGRISMTRSVVLSGGEKANDARMHLGVWFLGLGDASTHWAPAICHYLSVPSPFSSTDTRYLYGPKFKPGIGDPTVGCREWAYQLRDPGRPYIDITSYVPKDVDADGTGAYIYETLGWAGFDDNKPIIGRNDNTWYCLHDCPGASKPGPIEDIAAWASKQGWPTPKPPTRIPVFPDPPAREGKYP